MATNKIPMVFILVDIKMGWDLVQVFLSGIMEKYSKVIGKMEWKKVTELGNHPRETDIKGNGFKINNMDMACLNIELVHTEDNSKIT